MKKDRVQRHTAEKVNEQIDVAAERRILRSAGQSRSALSRRIEQLDGEWDIERWLELNASALALGGVLLGIFVNKKFLAIPCVVLPFLFQHALQGWCPPIPFFRRNGVRTRREIDAEKFALKMLRGDFKGVAGESRDHTNKAREVWRAVNA